MKVIEEMRADLSYEGDPADEQVRTLWHSLYDQQAGTAEFSFYLGDKVEAGSNRRERRSDSLRFRLEASFEA